MLHVKFAQLLPRFHSVHADGVPGLVVAHVEPYIRNIVPFRREENLGKVASGALNLPVIRGSPFHRRGGAPRKHLIIIVRFRVRTRENHQNFIRIQPFGILNRSARLLTIGIAQGLQAMPVFVQHVNPAMVDGAGSAYHDEQLVGVHIQIDIRARRCTRMSRLQPNSATRGGTPCRNTRIFRRC